MQMVRGGQTAININGEVGPFFPNGWGVRQGDPLSTLLFNIISDVLVAMLDRAKVAGHISGVAARVVPGGLSHLQYADDTLILIKKILRWKSSILNSCSCVLRLCRD